MPGSSLWLLPPPSSPLNDTLDTLIHSIPSIHFPSATPRPPLFLPHVTLTSDINPSLYGSDPQSWLESLPFPTADQVNVIFERVCTEDVFFRRCYIKLIKDSKATAGLKELAKSCRLHGVLNEEQDKQTRAGNWVDSAYVPHLSLMYSDTKLDTRDIDAVEKSVVEKDITLYGKSGPRGGWQGGMVVLVPTDQEISEWKPIARRLL